MMKISYKKLKSSAVAPDYKSAEAAGADLSACLNEPMVIESGGQAMVPTGIAIGLPRGFEAQIRPRSGLAARHGVTVLNSPGTIDSDYRGELQVILINHGKQDFKINHGERIAQLVIARHEVATFESSDSLEQTVRGEKGFGSTGTGD